nr:methyltransferase domain-containing protein [Haloactinospora alba]
MDSEWGAAFADVDTSEVRPYQDVLVPSVFHPWGCLLAGRLAPEEGEDVLDVGTGPGSVARIMASAVGPTGSVVGTDISKAMLTLAAEKPRPDGAPVRYVECGAAPLELPDGVFDVATVQQVLQFVPDRGAALSEMRRVLRRGGRIGVVTWLGLERNPLFNALHSAVAEILGEDAAERFGEPWSVGSDEVVRLVTQAGFGSVSVEEVSLPTAFPGGAEDVCRVYDFSAVRSEVAALEPALQRALRALVGAHLASSTDDTGGIHSHTAASVVLARA